MRGLWSLQQIPSVVGGKALAGNGEDNARCFSATGGNSSCHVDCWKESSCLN